MRVPLLSFGMVRNLARSLAADLAHRHSLHLWSEDLRSLPMWLVQDGECPTGTFFPDPRPLPATFPVTTGAIGLCTTRPASGEFGLRCGFCKGQ